MAKFNVTYHVTFRKEVSIEAKDEDEAKAIVSGWIAYNPYDTSNIRYVNHQVVRAKEDKDND